MPIDTLQLAPVPSVMVGMLIRRPPADVFQASVDPAVTTRFWYTKSSGRMTPGAALVEWEMDSVSSHLSVRAVEENNRVLFDWTAYNPDQPTTVEFRFIPWNDAANRARSPKLASPVQRISSLDT